jgi:hypothetical protein
MATKSKQAQQAGRVRKLGFDKSHVSSDRNGVAVRCSQCEAMVINGVPCHEQGCPNAKKRHGEDE